MPSEAEIERLRLEADTIMTRYGTVESTLKRARNESGEHWETEEIPVTLETPQGERIEVTLDLHADPAENAESRYERAKELEAELKRKQQVVGELAVLPTDPVAYLLCYHLDRVEGNYPRSMAGHLDAERGHVERLCEEMKTAGIVERVESGTVKQRRVKAKQADEVRQHHTYYRLSRQGDHLLRLLREREGQRNVLRHLPDGARLVRRLERDGPDCPRRTAEELGMAFESVRHCYRALERVGLVTADEGHTNEVGERETESRGSHTYYAVTDRASAILREDGR